MSKGCVIVQDRKGQRRPCFEILGVPDITKMVAIANGIKDLVGGKVVEVRYTQNDKSVTDNYNAGNKDLVHFKALMNFYDLTATAGESPNIQVEMPAPIDSLFVENEKGELIVADMHGDNIAVLIGTALGGRTVEFRGGKLIKRHA